MSVVRVGLLRQGRDVECAVVVEDDAVQILGVHGQVRYAQDHVPKRHEELVGPLARPKISFRKATTDGQMIDRRHYVAMGVKIVLFPAS